MRDDDLSIKAISRQPIKQPTCGYDRGIHWVCADLGDTDSLAKACDGVDIVIHVAGIAHSGRASRGTLLNTNFVGTQNLYNASLKAGVKKFIFVSSVHASLPSLSNYSYSKRVAEDYLISKASEHPEVGIVILRPANIYGAGMKGNIATFIRLAKTGILPLLPERNKSFELISIKDFCMTIMEILAAEIPARATLNYTVTDGNLYTARRIEDAVYNCLGSGRPKLEIPVAILFLVILVSHVINLVGFKKNLIGLDLFHTLFRSNRHEPTTEFTRYSISGCSTFEMELPSILASLTDK